MDDEDYVKLWERFCDRLALAYPGEIPSVSKDEHFSVQAKKYAEICQWISGKLKAGEKIAVPGAEDLLG